MTQLNFLSPQDIRAIRLGLGMTQEHLASVVGLRREKLSAWELGKLRERDPYPPTTQQCEAITAYLKLCLENEVLYPKAQKNEKTILGSMNRNTRKIVSKEKANETRKLRLSLGLSFKQVKELTGFSPTMLHDNETGRHNMSQETYDALMKAYRSEKLKRIFGKNYKDKENGGKHEA